VIARFDSVVEHAQVDVGQAFGIVEQSTSMATILPCTMVKLITDTARPLATMTTGPRVYGMDDLVRSQLHRIDRHRLILPVKVPGQARALLGRARIWRQITR